MRLYEKKVTIELIEVGSMGVNESHVAYLCKEYDEEKAKILWDNKSVAPPYHRYQWKENYVERVIAMSTRMPPPENKTKSIEEIEEMIKKLYDGFYRDEYDDEYDSGYLDALKWVMGRE